MEAANNLGRFRTFTWLFCRQSTSQCVVVILLFVNFVNNNYFIEAYLVATDFFAELGIVSSLMNCIHCITLESSYDGLSCDIVFQIITLFIFILIIEDRLKLGHTGHI